MGRGERIGSKNNSRGHARKRNVKSDDSDEDYMLEEDQSDDQSDDLDLLVVDASDEESLGSFVEEENVRKVVKPKSRKQPIGRRKNGIKRSRKRTRIADEEEEDDEDYEVEKDDVDADSLDGGDDGDGGDDASLDSFVDEEEEENFRNFLSPTYHRSSIGQWKTGIRSSRKRRMIADDEDCEVEKGNDVDADSIDGCGGGGNAASLGGFVDVEEEENVRKVVGPISHKRSIGLAKNGSKTSRKRKRLEDDEGDDEDYDDDEEEDNDVDSIDGGSFSNFIDEEEEENSRKIVRTESRKRSNGKTKDRNRSLRKKISDDEDFEEEYKDVDDDIIDVAGGGGHGGVNGIRSSRKRIEDDEDFEEEEDNDVDADTFNAVVGSGSGGGPCSDAGSHGSDDDEEDDYEDDEDDEDDEFTPEELDFFDEEENLSPKGIRGRGYLKSKGTVRSRKRKTGTKLLKNPQKNRRKGSSRSSKPTSGSRSSKSPKKVLPSRGRCKRRSMPRKKKAKTCSDSDFVSTEPSDCEFTISEEEREQVREANEFCRRTRSNLKSLKPEQRDTADNQVKNRPRRKGKEKAEEKAVEIKSDVGKQVCGICLTEEGKNTMRGTLDCCGHFFCFVCIMEWSKVESRCPLCKQRFSTISKPARSGTRIDLRNVVIHVPERDQVYQPSEEELRDYLDPYENVYCTECHEGGDDALMLLCDVCDSPAHTYCVGLGREVPEGNWYCEGCRPSALGSTSSHAPDLTPTQRLNNDSFTEPTFENMAEIDLNITIPETPVTPVNGFLLSPRQPLGASLQAPPPISTVGVSTLSGRRRVHRLQYLLSSNRLSQMGMRVDRAAQSSSFETNTADVGPSYHAEYVDRLQENPSSSQNLGSFPGRLGLIRGQPQPLQAPAADTSAYDGIQLGGIGGINLELNCIPGREFLQPCTSRLNLASGISTSSFNSFYNRDVDQTAVKQQVQSLVKNQLKNLCRDMGLGHDTLKQILVSSTNTILATCGLGDSRTEVYEMQPPLCLHTEALFGPQTSVIRGCCQACVDSFVMEVVRTIMDVKMKAAEQLSFRNF